ncbi:sushi, von Willebrand factor type A, EGF and pentraxin domain-containing protein 1-like [Sycon ciliatum]|uniref:sushi, von Willebrand factor type A, EGF and pentraxin domain-containing protein 1-like n=1 Tax=Sycon ciliatum TaxID=27933 RepID=UPI0031F5FA5D
MATFVAYRAGCVSAALEELMIAWLNKDDVPGVALVADTSPIHSTRYKTQVLYAMCETSCTRQSGDHIVDVSSDGNVTCDIGYEYLDAQPVCNSTTTVEMCTAVNCTVPGILNGTANASVIHFGQKVRYACTWGLQVIGDATPACTPSRTLTSVPFCEILNCSVPTVQFGMSNVSLVQYGATVQFTCQQTYFLLGNSSATCKGDGTLSSVPICYSLTGLRVCRPPNIVTRITGTPVNYNSARALCSSHNGTILSEASFHDGCSIGLTSANRVAWRGLPDTNNKALTTSGGHVDLSRHFLVVCEIPCLPRQNGQMESKPMADDISCRYDVLNCSVPIIRFGMSNVSLVQYGATVQFTCQHTYFLLGNSSATCKGDGTLSSLPLCYKLTGRRVCTTTMTLIETTETKLSYTSGNELCSRHNGTILSEASFHGGCSTGLTDDRVAWRGLPDKNNKVLNTKGTSLYASVHLLVVCEIPCIPRSTNQMVSKPMASDISCRYDELIGNTICRESGSITRISTPGLILNYISAQALCGRHNGTILSEASFHASCSVGLTHVHKVAWVGSPKGNVALNSNSKYVGLAQLLRVVCEIPLYCNVPVIVNGTADRNVVRFTHSVTYSCQEGQGIVGDATPNCTANGNLTSVPYCDVLNCSVPTILLGMINDSLTPRTGMSNARLIHAGDTVQYTCEDGYFFQGSPTVTCFGDGSLRPVPICYPLYCTVPVIINGTADRTVVRFTHNVTYSCQEGQGIVGDATPNCTADGNLTSVPYCDVLNCSVPAIQFGMINSSLRLRTGMSNATLIHHGDTVQYTCQDGYFVEGSSTVTCFGDGSLRPVPLCYCKYFNHVHYFLLVSSSYYALLEAGLNVVDRMNDPHLIVLIPF